MAKDGCNVCCTGIIYIVAVFNCHCCGDVTLAEADRNMDSISRLKALKCIFLNKNIMPIKGGTCKVCIMKENVKMHVNCVAEIPTKAGMLTS